MCPHKLVNDHGKGIGFFPRRTCRRPDSDIFRLPPSRVGKLWQDVGRQKVEVGYFSKKTCEVCRNRIYEMNQLTAAGIIYDKVVIFIERS